MVANSRREEPVSSQAVVQFITRLEEHDPQVIADYLLVMVLDAHLGKYVAEPPIDGVYPTSMRLIAEVRKAFPELDANQANSFKQAVSRYLLEKDYASKYFRYKPFN